MADHPAPPGLMGGLASQARSTRVLRIPILLCFAIPGLMLVVSFGWLAIDHGTWALADVIVHESGRYTLMQTVLYFGHFLRELPVDVGYALFVLAVVPNAAAGTADARARGRILAWAGLLPAVVLVGFSLLVASRDHGWGSVARDLLQFRTRDDQMAYGSHWQFHWLSTAWFGASSGLVLTAVNRWRGTVPMSGDRLWQIMAWSWFAALTVVFGISPRIVTDGRYIGHQAREILTHGPTTLLLAIGVALCALSWLGVNRGHRSAERIGVTRVRLAVALLVPVYLGIATVAGDALATGQRESGIAGMVAAHWFEHTLDYALVVMLVLGGLGLRTWFSSARGADSMPPGKPHA